MPTAAENLDESLSKKSSSLINLPTSENGNDTRSNHRLHCKLTAGPVEVASGENRRRLLGGMSRGIFADKASNNPRSAN